MGIFSLFCGVLLILLVILLLLVGLSYYYSKLILNNFESKYYQTVDNYYTLVNSVKTLKEEVAIDIQLYLKHAKYRDIKEDQDLTYYLNQINISENLTIKQLTALQVNLRVTQDGIFKILKVI